MSDQALVPSHPSEMQSTITHLQEADQLQWQINTCFIEYDALIGDFLNVQLNVPGEECINRFLDAVDKLREGRNTIRSKVIGLFNLLKATQDKAKAKDRDMVRGLATEVTAPEALAIRSLPTGAKKMETAEQNKDSFMSGIANMFKGFN